MNFLTVFCIFGLFAATSLAAPASNLPDNLFYIVNLTISENEARIAFYDVQVNLTQNRFDHFVESLRYKNKLVSRTLFHGERNFTNLAFLNISSQDCVIHYGRLPELATVQGTINNCISDASRDGGFLLLKVEVSLDNAREENNFIKKAVDNCATNNTGYKLSDCVNAAIKKHNGLIRNILDKTDKEFQIALDNFDVSARTAMECTFNVVEGLAAQVEDVNRSVDECNLNFKNN
uniref:Protein TsetseEP domain-containing protein n=1 Tax=Megaselia scalaris TaxID=36166 RepID=T1H212_MEGSC